MPYTLKQAAEATGKTKPTILRAIQGGKISATKDAHGEWMIDPAELHRVYPPVTVRTDENATAGNDTQHSKMPDVTDPLRHEVEFLREKLSMLTAEREREREQLSDQIEDLRRRLDSETQERRATQTQLTALLTDQRTREEPPQADSPAPTPAADMPPPVPEAAAPPPAPPARRTLWQKLTGRSAA